MPTQRKRIGYLPKVEVQIIIDQICNQNKLSQSKVTGILVEEALTTRGVLNNSLNKTSFELLDDYKKLLITSDIINNYFINDNDDFNLNDSYINNDVQMINDYIEFKIFKQIMNKNKYFKN